MSQKPFQDYTNAELLNWLKRNMQIDNTNITGGIDGSVIVGDVDGSLISDGTLDPDALPAQTSGSVSTFSEVIPTSTNQTVDSWSSLVDGTYIDAQAKGLVVTKPGLYIVSAWVQWPSGTAGQRNTQIEQFSSANAGLNSVVQTQLFSTGLLVNPVISWVFSASLNDYFTLILTHNQGSNVTVTSGAMKATRLT